GAHGPHQHVGRDALAMERGAMGFEEVALAGRAMQLPPGTTARMPVGTEIASPHPAPRGTVRLGAEVRRRVHLARAAARGHEAGWRAPGRLGARHNGLHTGLAAGRVGEARKRLRDPRALAGWW